MKKLFEGERSIFQYLIGNDIVRRFSAVTEDTNPIYWNEDYCSITPIKTPTLPESLILAIMQQSYTRFIGKGYIVRSSILNCKKIAPFSGEKRKYYAVSVKVLSVKDEVVELEIKFGKLGPESRGVKPLPSSTEVVDVMAEAKFKLIHVLKIKDSSNAKK